MKPKRQKRIRTTEADTQAHAAAVFVSWDAHFLDLHINSYSEKYQGDIHTYVH